MVVAELDRWLAVRPDERGELVGGVEGRAERVVPVAADRRGAVADRVVAVGRAPRGAGDGDQPRERVELTRSSRSYVARDAEPLAKSAVVWLPTASYW